ncbi:MAG: hypothetical protein KAJ46_05155 [Sedimentisphaerales bacterium]|nr:hypothetical protein [Sedimentisphaerales bacterium]
MEIPYTSAVVFCVVLLVILCLGNGCIPGGSNFDITRISELTLYESTVQDVKTIISKKGISPIISLYQGQRSDIVLPPEVKKLRIFFPKSLSAALTDPTLVIAYDANGVVIGIRVEKPSGKPEFVAGVLKDPSYVK